MPWKTDHPKLCGWALVYKESNPYNAPELQSVCLCGNARLHPRFRNGENITTSRIIGKTEDGCVRTLNTTYELGLPSDSYEAMFPDAKQRLLNSLEVVTDETACR